MRMRGNPPQDMEKRMQEERVTQEANSSKVMAWMQTISRS